jgi:hypothetical protein
MTHTFPQGSAKIYQFPVRAGAAVNSDRQNLKSGADLTSSLASAVAVATGWYHEAAIQDSNRDREH